MTPTTMSPSPRQRAAEMNETLRIWANALGCSTAQVAEVVRQAGLPMEKLWNSLNHFQPFGTGARPSAGREARA